MIFYCNDLTDSKLVYRISEIDTHVGFSKSTYRFWIWSIDFSISIFQSSWWHTNPRNQILVDFTESGEILNKMIFNL